jgi:hypothetical protein
MKIWRKPVVLLPLMLLALISLAEVRSAEVLWLDFDMKNIPEPKERPAGYYEYFFKGQFIEGTKQKTDLPRWARLIAGRPKQASNVNAVDEVPDSSWYTNRHRLHRMSAAELRRGPNSDRLPDFSKAVITKAKSSGVTPGFMVKDANGDSFLIKFDSAQYPNLRSGAEAISTKIMYAAGYNVPENYIAYVDAKNLTIGDDVKVTDLATKLPRPLTKDDVDKMLQNVAKASDGRLRVLASKIIPGKAKGPFAQVGLRADDPNDLIPHEHRRELRAIRAIASWINNWDLKEEQSLDMYVEQDGRKFLRHYLLDFGSSLGAGDDPGEYYHGHEYGLDLSSISKELFSLGLYKSGNEKRALIISPEVGSFTAAEFDPGNWKPSYASVLFNNMTDLDAFWATRVMLSFTEDDLRNIVETAEYSSAATNNYILQTLLERRRMVAGYWLKKVDALSDFAVRSSGDGVAVTFKDLLVDQKLVGPDSANYSYQIRGAKYTSVKRTVQRPEIQIDRETLGAAVERGVMNTTLEVRIWTNRKDFTADPVRVYFDWNPARDSFPVRRISRG